MLFSVPSDRLEGAKAEKVHDQPDDQLDPREWPDDADVDDDDDTELVRCVACGEWIAEDAPQCPACKTWQVPAGQAERRPGWWVWLVVTMVLLIGGYVVCRP